MRDERLNKNLKIAYRQIAHDYTKTKVLKVLADLKLKPTILGEEPIYYIGGFSYACLTDCIYLQSQDGALGYCFFNDQIVRRIGSAGEMFEFNSLDIEDRALTLLPLCDGEINQNCLFRIEKGKTAGDYPCRRGG